MTDPAPNRSHTELFDTIAGVEALALAMLVENELRPDPARMAADIAELKRRVARIEAALCSGRSYHVGIK